MIMLKRVMIMILCHSITMDDDVDRPCAGECSLALILSWHRRPSTRWVWNNKVIALRGSTPKRDTQQQCVCTINTAKPCHAMSHHDIKCNTIQVQPVQCNPVPFHATPYRAIPCNAMPPHAIQRHSLLIQYHTMQRHVTSCHAMEIRAI